jgi:electron transfer flavoprotein beta subunit
MIKILVPVKRVAFLDDEFELNDAGVDVDQDFCEYDINEFDDYSLESALLLKEAYPDTIEIVAVTVGSEDADEVLRKCLAKGADRAIRVWDDAVEGSDQIGIARLLAKVVERENPSLVLCGAQGVDHGYAQTGIAVAGFLKWPHVAVVSNLEWAPDAKTIAIRRELEGGLEDIMTVQMPALLTIQLGLNRPRYASLRGIRQAAAQPIEVIGNADLGINDNQVGAAGALSRIRRMYVPAKGRAEMITGTPTQQATRIIEIINTFKGA